LVEQATAQDEEFRLRAGELSAEEAQEDNELATRAAVNDSPERVSQGG